MHRHTTNLLFALLTLWICVLTGCWASVEPCSVHDVLAPDALSPPPQTHIAVEAFTALSEPTQNTLPDTLDDHERPSGTVLDHYLVEALQNGDFASVTTERTAQTQYSVIVTAEEDGANPYWVTYTAIMGLPSMLLPVPVHMERFDILLVGLYDKEGRLLASRQLNTTFNMGGLSVYSLLIDPNHPFGIQSARLLAPHIAQLIQDTQTHDRAAPRRPARQTVPYMRARCRHQPPERDTTPL